MNGHLLRSLPDTKMHVPETVSVLRPIELTPRISRLHCHTMTLWLFTNELYHFFPVNKLRITMLLVC